MYNYGGINIAIEQLRRAKLGNKNLWLDLIGSFISTFGIIKGYKFQPGNYSKFMVIMYFTLLY